MKKPTRKKHIGRGGNEGTTFNPRLSMRELITQNALEEVRALVERDGLPQSGSDMIRIHRQSSAGQIIRPEFTMASFWLPSGQAAAVFRGLYADDEHTHITGDYHLLLNSRDFLAKNTHPGIDDVERTLSHLAQVASQEQAYLQCLQQRCEEGHVIDGAAAFHRAAAEKRILDSEKIKNLILAAKGALAPMPGIPLWEPLETGAMFKDTAPPVPALALGQP